MKCEVSGQWSSGSSAGHRIRIHRDVMWCTWLKTVMAAWRRAAPTAVRGLRARPGSLPHFPLPRPDLKRNASSFHAIPATLLSCVGTDNALNVLFLTPSQLTKCFRKQIQINKRDEVWFYFLFIRMQPTVCDAMCTFYLVITHVWAWKGFLLKPQTTNGDRVLSMTVNTSNDGLRSYALSRQTILEPCVNFELAG